MFFAKPPILDILAYSALLKNILIDSLYAFNASGDLLTTSKASLAGFPLLKPFLKVVSNIASSPIFNLLPISLVVNLVIVSLFKSSLPDMVKLLNFCNSSKYSFPAFFLNLFLYL